MNATFSCFRKAYQVTAVVASLSCLFAPGILCFPVEIGLREGREGKG